jgi:hypothetical protein
MHQIVVDILKAVQWNTTAMPEMVKQKLIMAKVIKINWQKRIPHNPKISSPIRK